MLSDYPIQQLKVAYDIQTFPLNYSIEKEMLSYGSEKREKYPNWVAIKRTSPSTRAYGETEREAVEALITTLHG